MGTPAESAETVQMCLRHELAGRAKHGVATADGALNGSTVISLWDEGAAEGIGEPDGFWNDSWLLILTGDMKDQRRRVTGWVQATGTLTVDPRFINPKVSMLTADSPLGDTTIEVADASAFSTGEAFIWDTVTPGGEAVTITDVDTVANVLTIDAPGIVQPLGYLVANLAAISMSPRITDGTHFRLEAVSKIEDTGKSITPEEKGRIFNTAIALNTDFFAADLEPTNSPTTFRIYAAMDAAGILNVMRTSAGVTVTEHLNAGGDLNADSAYIFDILVHEDDTINLQYSVGAQILYCLVIEVPGVIG